MRKLIMLIPLIAASIALSACGGPKAEEPAADAATTTEAAPATEAAAPAADATAKPATAADESTDESHTGGTKVQPGG